MRRNSFRGLYLQKTSNPFHFSFITYTPQTREQMIACGDLGLTEEYLNPVIFDFLLFVSERVLELTPTFSFSIHYDDVSIICSRKRGKGSQHEYLLFINQNNWNDCKQVVLDKINMILSHKSWNGSYLI